MGSRRIPTAALAAAVMLPVVAIAGPVTDTWEYRPRRTHPSLFAEGLALDASGAPRDLPPGAGPQALHAGTRVLRPVSARDARTAAAAATLAARQQEWLRSGTVPGENTRWGGMVRDALLDLHTLGAAHDVTLPPGAERDPDAPRIAPGARSSPGAVVAAWAQSWRYVWPRDASFVAAALARSGHSRDAADVLAFLQSIQPAAGVFEARYLSDGSGPPDDRGQQLDGTGWVLWSAGEVLDAMPARDRASFLTRLRPLVVRSTAAAIRLTDTPTGLPPVAADYWEMRETQRTLGTAAPLAAGLEAAVQLNEALGEHDAARRARVQAVRLRAAIHESFAANGYSRYPSGDHHLAADGYPRPFRTPRKDAAIAFLLPPFAEEADPRVLAAWRQAIDELRRPGGGISPGGGAKHEDISWTPETAVFTLVAAASGERRRAEEWLDWFATHRTRVGALPEKVLNDGSPVGPAPLGWTAAAVVLAVAELEAAGPTG